MQTFAQYGNLGLCTVHISCKRSTVEKAVLYIHMHFAHGTTAEKEVEKTYNHPESTCKMCKRFC